MRYKKYFFFDDTATTKIYTLALHDALRSQQQRRVIGRAMVHAGGKYPMANGTPYARAADVAEIGRAHVWTSVTITNLVCRLLLEKKNIDLTHFQTLNTIN